MKIRVVVITNGKRWIAHGESSKGDNTALQVMKVECDPQWATNLAKDMICVVEADVPYAPNRLQSFTGLIAPSFKSKVLRQPPLRSRAGPAPEKTLAQASAESTGAGGMQDRCVSIPPPIKVKRGPPRIEDRGKTLTATKPWLKCNPPMSRRSWYRRQAEAKA